MSTIFKRNDVVITKENRGYAFYGRVFKVLKNGNLIVLDSGSRMTGYPSHVMRKSSYTGRKIDSHFLNMVTLRKLIKMVKVYNPEMIPEQYDNGEGI